jgi:hypothetical protein
MEKEDAVTIRNASHSAIPPIIPPEYQVFGSKHPIGARRHLYGRHNIIMTSWGPWDHKSPLIRMVQDNGDSMKYSLHKLPRNTEITVEGHDIKGILSRSKDSEQADTYTVSATQPGIHPYRFRVKSNEFEELLEGTLISTVWDVTFFKWTKDIDPRKDIRAWRQLALKSPALAKIQRLSFSYAWRGPSERKLSEAVTTVRLGSDYFGMIATTRVPLPAGRWNIATLSDDGVRVTIDDREIIDNWTWHGPTRDTGTFILNEAKTVEICVEHFEIDGYATLEVKISRQSSHN